MKGIEIKEEIVKRLLQQASSSTSTRMLPDLNGLTDYGSPARPTISLWRAMGDSFCRESLFSVPWISRNHGQVLEMSVHLGALPTLEHGEITVRG